MLRGTMLIATVLALLLAPAAASAASKPGVRTGGVSLVTPSTVTLNGRVDPNNAATTYFFQLGTTSLYGVNTAAGSAGGGGTLVPVNAPVTGLAPATTYHYRVVAQNARGITKGADRTFKTRVQPLGVTLAATPNPVSPPGAPVTLAGQLTGTNNAGRQVVLQSNPFPFSRPEGFLAEGNPQVTDAAGNFSFPVLSLPVTTQYRVLMPQKPEVVSPIVVVGAAVAVRTDTRKVARHRHSVSVRFRGSVSPPTDSLRVDIQKLRAGAWTTIAHTRAKHATASKSSYRTRVRLFRSGQFRAVAEAAGQYVAGAGRVIDITVRR
ncbi:MAG: hypothetical protein ACR2L8_00595 [Solirubrobacteraceae bacterium]